MRYFLFFMITMTCCSCDHYEARNHHARAVALEDTEQYPQAVSELDQAITLYPGFTEAYINRAIDQSILENYPAAINDITAAIALEPKWIEPYVIRAEYLRVQNRATEALADLEKAIKLKFPRYNQASKIRFHFSSEKDDFGYRDAPLSYIFNERAWAYYAIDSLHLALDAINYSIENRFNEANGLYLRSLIFFAFDDRNQACRDLSAAKQYGFKDIPEKIQKYCAGWTDRGLLETFPEG